MYVRTHKFVTIRQCAGENYSSYLLRVEKLSRGLGFFDNNNRSSYLALQEARKSLALVLAVIGLRDQSLCKELIAKDDLTWEYFETILRSREIAEESVDKLHSEINCVNASTVTKADAEQNFETVYYRCGSNSKASDSSHNVNCGKFREHNMRYRHRYRNSYFCGSRPRTEKRTETEQRCYDCGGPRHPARLCPMVKCRNCGHRGHIGSDCGQSKCWRCGDSTHHNSGCWKCKSKSPTPFWSGRHEPNLICQNEEPVKYWCNASENEFSHDALFPSLQSNCKSEAKTILPLALENGKRKRHKALPCNILGENSSNEHHSSDNESTYKRVKTDAYAYSNDRHNSMHVSDRSAFHDTGADY